MQFRFRLMFLTVKLGMTLKSDFLIKPFTEKIADAVVKIENACFSEPWSRDAVLSSYNFNTKFFVAEKDGVIIGYIGVQNIAGEGFITNVAVLPDYQGCGVGTALLNTAVEFCKSAGMVSLSLEVRKSNLTAIKIYEKAGFKTVGQRKNFYSKPTEDAVIYTVYFS